MYTSSAFSPHRSPRSEVRSDTGHSPIDQADNQSLSSRPTSHAGSHRSGSERDSELEQVSSQFPGFISLAGTPRESMDHLSTSTSVNMDRRDALPEDEPQDEDQFTTSDFQSHLYHPSASSSSYLQFTHHHDPHHLEPETENDFLDQDEVSHQHPTDDADRTDNQMNDDHDSLMDASESEVERQALAILGIDRDGRVLPPSAKDELLLQSLWTRAGTCDLRPGLAPFNTKPIDPNSPHAPRWFLKLQSDVLVQPPSKAEDEEILVNSIKKNLLAIVNNLSEDQWRHPAPPAFLPSATIPSSSRANSEAFETAHEDYLQTDFNPLSQVSLVPSSPFQTSPQLPRQLWLGEDEDDGVDSDASLVDLLSANGSHGDQSHLSPGWGFGAARRPNNRHGQASSLARQVSRLGMAE